MSEDKNKVSLTIGGTEFSGWKSARIEAGIDRQARTFDLEVTSKWPGSPDTATRIKQGDAVEVKIGGDLVITGYVDATPIRYDGKGYTVGVKGRSKTGDLVDCCPVTKATSQWRTNKLEKIAAELAKPYGINVVTEVDTGNKISGFSFNNGDTVFGAIDQMMRERHVLSTDNAKGELVFIKVGSSGRCVTKLELGQNIRSASASLDYSGIFSEYTCLGQSAGTDETEPDVFSTGFASTQSTIINRKRVLVLVQSGNANSGVCKERVEYEKAHRAAKALETDYIVSGWREENGDLWQPNKIVKVRDGMIGFDTEMLIVGVSYVLDADGQRTEIKVGPPDGYKTKAEKKQASQGWADVQK